MPDLDRRAFLGLAATSLFASPHSVAPRTRHPRERSLLVFTKSAGFEHSTVARRAGGSVVDAALLALGEENGFRVHATKDGSVFSSGIDAYDAFLFVTTGNLLERGTDGEPPMTSAGKRALLDAVAGGRGFVGVHNAADTFRSPPGGPLDPYIAMLGGEFEAHGQPQQGTLRVVDATFPGMPASAGIERLGEWYAFRNVAPDIRPLLTLETAGLAGAEYERPPYPVAWTRRHGKGRVAYNALGHFDGEWSDAVFRGMLLGMVQWAFGDEEAGAG